jgi:transketolase|tara:strand:+ start:209 stop:1138 length:930 start_codon:yes stop_codon:yes gene_type:complete
MNENYELKKMREGYGDAVIDLAKNDEKVVFVGADSGGHERKWFFENARERLVETGIAEANSAVIAGALASDGFKPFVLNFAYLHARMYNQISQSIAEDNYPVRMAGYYAGVWGFGGRSHNCINDLAFMRALPNFNVFAASDYWEAKTLVKKVASLNAPSYIRLAGVPTPIVHDSEPEFSPFRKHLDGNDCTIFCHGTMLHEALQACTEEKMGASVVNIPQIKPLPTEEIIREAKATGGAVVVEEHSYIGGLAESISSLLSENYPITVKKVCVDDIFPVSVRMEEEEVYEKFGISRHEIKKAVKSIVNQR